MATGLSAVTAAFVWTKGQVRGWRQEKAATRIKNWRGYIDLGQVNTWYVRLIEEPTSPTARVILEIIDNDGTPNEQMAHSLRQVVKRDRLLSRSPTPGEFEFLKQLYRERGYGKGIRIE